MSPRLYLAGPAVFFPNAEQIRVRLIELCVAHGAVGVWPAEGAGYPAAGELSPRRAAETIFAQNLDRLRLCDAVVADISPFRGPHCDVGTAFEIGFGEALGKPVFAYTQAQQHEPGALLRLADRIWAERTGSGEWRDAHGHLVEDFDLVDNLMIGCAVRWVGTSAERAIERAAAHITGTSR